MARAKVLPFEIDSRFLHKRAVRSIDKQDFLSGLKHLRRARELDPDSIEIGLDIADTYARMGLYESSNVELELLLHREDCPDEAMFAIGCNHMAMGDYAQAYAVFEAYIALHEDGEYSFLARDGMEQILESEMEDGIDREIEGIAERGKAALDAGDPAKAKTLFEEVLEREPDLSYVRNNLALAYICTEEHDRAWEQINIILQDEPHNVHACCNAALLLKMAGNMDEAELFIARINPELIEEVDELYKFCLTTAELHSVEKLMQGLRKILLLCPYETAMLYLMGACLYNEGKYAEAARHFEKILGIDPSYFLARDALQQCERSLQGQAAAKEIPFSFEYSQAQRDQIDEALLGLLHLYPDQRQMQKEAMREENQNMLVAALQGEDDMAVRAMLMLTAMGGDFAQDQLRRVLLSVIHSDQLKQLAVESLRKIGVEPPFYAVNDGRIVRFVQSHFQLNDAPPKAYTTAMAKTLQLATERYDDPRALDYAVTLWTALINSFGGHFPAMRDEGAWIAAVFARYEEDVMGENPDLEQLAQEYGTTQRTVLFRMRRLYTALAQQKEMEMEHETD